ncbi:MAG: hypothetical protein Q9227_004293 [Pyrenula ochraceoflavens]
MASSTASSLSQRNLTSPDLLKDSTDLLVSYLVVAKRALNISHPQVVRASEIVGAARSAVESSVARSAQTAFVHCRIGAQLKILRGVQFEVEEVAHTAQVEFNSVLKSLDAADAKLRKTLDELQATIVEHGFRPTDEEPQSLLHFIDEEPVDTLKDNLKDSIDETNDAKRVMDESNAAFEEELQAINGALTEKTTDSISSESEFTPPTLRSLLRGAEDHAKEIAESLEGLVKHYDLCVSAVKNTEGGGAVVKDIGDDLPAGVDVDRPDADKGGPPLTDEERHQLMNVIRNDASEVEDVIAEIQDRIAEMEVQLNQINSFKERKDIYHNRVIQGFRLLEQLSNRLPNYITQSQIFLSRWNEQKAKIDQGMAELENFHEVYSNYLEAYDGLLIEVARRRAVQSQMEKIMQEAQAKLQRLHDDDSEAREAFKQDQGDYLPSDIWPGLTDPPMKVRFERIDNHDGGSLPSLKRSTVEGALRRLQKRS